MAKQRKRAAPQHWTPAYVGLGSNLNEPEQQVRRAVTALGKLPDTRLVFCSRLYRNPPMGRSEQPDFVNAAVGLLTRLEPAALLAELQNIEAAHGRRRGAERWGPRVLDLDLLVYDALQTDTDELRLPHPGAHERAFVLVPLADFAPELDIPGRGRVRALVEGCDAGALVALD